MQNTQLHFTGPGNANIFYQLWEPDGAAKALLIIAHGAAEHSGRYQQLAEACTQRGYIVAALDHIGHGHSDGRPGFIRCFDDYIAGLDQLRSIVQEKYANLPTFLLGHSMGGLIAARHLLQAQQQYTGCVLSGPAITSDVQPPAWQIAIMRLLSKLLPRLGVIQLDASAVSRDAQVVKNYLQDPLVYTGKLSARKVVEMFDAMRQIQRDATQISLPLLILHGGDDRLTSPEGSKLLYSEASSADKKLVVYPGLYHEIFNEPEREQVWAEMLAWCDSHVA